MASEKIDMEFLEWVLLNRRDVVDAARLVKETAPFGWTELGDPETADGLESIIAHRCEGVFRGPESHYGDRHMDRASIPERRRDFLASACMNALMFDAMMQGLYIKLQSLGEVSFDGKELCLGGFEMKSAVEYGKEVRAAWFAFDNGHACVIVEVWYDLPEVAVCATPGGMLSEKVQVGIEESWNYDSGIYHKANYPICELRDIAKTIKGLIAEVEIKG